jgi:hypothetical protein
MVFCTQVNILAVSIKAHVTHKSGWKDKSWILGWTISALSIKGKLVGIGQRLSAKVAFLLTLDNEEILVLILISNNLNYWILLNLRYLRCNHWLGEFILGLRSDSLKIWFFRRSMINLLRSHITWVILWMKRLVTQWSWET